MTTSSDNLIYQEVNVYIRCTKLQASFWEFRQRAEFVNVNADVNVKGRHFRRRYMRVGLYITLRGTLQYQKRKIYYLKTCRM